MVRSEIVWMMTLLALGAALDAAAARADESKAEETLKTHGLVLKRGSSTYVLAAESEVQTKLSQAQRLFRQFNAALARQYELDQEAIGQKGMIQELLEERILRNQQLRTVNPQDVIQHNQLVARINELNDQLRLLDPRNVDPKVKEDVDKEVSERRAAYIQDVLDLRQLASSTTQQYAELSRDDTIKTALAAIGAKSKTPLKLGPSRGFEENVKSLAKMEKSVLSKAIEMRPKGGVYEVDVTLNGRQTTPMIFDTGASLVTLSSEFAAKIGLTPQASDPTIRLHDATGGITDAKRMTIPSVRVGPFTLNNVVCAVMPPDKRDVPLLLGQSFINQFTHKIENGRLVLSKVETRPPRTNSPHTPKKHSKLQR
jgi:aspartyl protease family protein